MRHSHQQFQAQHITAQQQALLNTTAIPCLQAGPSSPTRNGHGPSGDPAAAAGGDSLAAEVAALRARVGVLEEAAVEALGEAEELRDAAAVHLEARRAAEQQVRAGCVVSLGVGVGVARCS